MAPLLALAFVAAGPVPASADVKHEDVLSAQWREIGPFPIEPGDPRTYSQFATTTGRVTAVAVSPTNADHVFIGAPAGGVWRSLDGGQSWKPILDGADTLAVDSLAIDSEGTLWVGTGSWDAPGVGLYRIRNAATGSLKEVREGAEGPFKNRVGGTGTGDEPDRSAFASRVVKAIAIDPNDPDRMFVATSGSSDLPYPDVARAGLYYTKNARAAEPEFSLVKIEYFFEVNVTDVDFVPGSSEELLVAVANPQEGLWGIWRTTSATSAATGGLIFFSRVKQIGLGDPTVTDRYTVLSASGDVVYAATSEKSGTIYKSTDRGKTFFRDEEVTANGFMPFRSSAQGWGIGTHHGTIAVDPGDPDNVYLGGSHSCALRCTENPSRTVLHSSDGGKRFHIADGPYRNRPETPKGDPHAYVHPDVTDMAFAPSDPNVVYNANDGGIYRAANGRVEEPPDASLHTHVSKVYFETRNTEGLGITQFYNLAVHPRDRHFTMGGTQDNGAVIQRTNGGKWQFVGGGDIFNVAIDQTATSTDTLPLYVDCYRYDTTADALLQGWPPGVRQDMEPGCWGGFWAQGPGATLTAPDIMYWGIKGMIRRTTDKGKTVAKFYDACSDLSPCPDVTAAATLPNRPDHLLVGHSDGSLRLIKGTETLWLKQLGNGAPITAIAVDPREGLQAAYIGLGAHLPSVRIYRIDDLLSPAPVFSVLDRDDEGNLELPRLPINSLVIDPQEPDHIFVGTDSGVFASVDGGSTWRPLGEGLPRGCERKGEVCGMRFSVRSARSMAITRNILRVASHGRGIWEIQIRPDRTPPEIRLESQTPRPNAAGWNNAEVALEWSCSDDESAVKAASVKVTLSEEGADQTAQGVCEDAAGNRATDTVRGIDIDLTAPTITLAERPAANGNGWYRGSVTIRWSCQDTLSKPAAAEVRRTLTTEGADQSLRGTCTDRAGNTASNTQTDLDIDLTAPTITLAHRPAANGNGWYREPVTIRWSCQDTLSKPLAAEVQSTLTTEGADQSLRGTCTDHAGNTASNTQSAINLDKTKPSIQIASPPDMGTFDLEQVVATSYDCADESSGSGLASCDGDVANGDPADTADAGQHTFTVVARDKADNASSKTVTYTVLKAPTSLAAEPLLLELDFGSLVVTVGRVSARLTYGPAAKPAAGRTVVFSAASKRLCTATTRPDGTATCTFGLTSTLRAALSLGYSVTFDGDHNLLPSTAEGSAAAILGWDVPG